MAGVLDLEVRDSSLVSAVVLFLSARNFIPHCLSSPSSLFPSRRGGGGGSSNIPSHFMLQKPEFSASLMGMLAHMQT